MELVLLFAAAAAIGFYQFTCKVIMWLCLLIIAGIVFFGLWPWTIVSLAVIALMYSMGEFDE